MTSLSIDPFKTVIGESKILIKETKKWSTLFIEGVHQGRGRYVFNAYIAENDAAKQVGSLMCYWLRNFEDGTWGGEYYGRPLTDEDRQCHYGIEKTAFKTNRIYVERLYSYDNDKYRGVGGALMQAALEWGDMDGKGCKGHLYLDAIGSSHKFYYNLGMRTTKAEMDEKIRAKPSRFIEADFGSYHMFMGPEGREMYEMRRAEAPIFK